MFWDQHEVRKKLTSFLLALPARGSGNIHLCWTRTIDQLPVRAEGTITKSDLTRFSTLILSHFHAPLWRAAPSHFP
ncbi:hypothetical protein KSC_105030 [Ktedonobacter sp. SOSP1-52]|nr:hypothetical protein KSC_105030 [Ktedonobacter sp. SOSP1-52]